MPVVSERNVDFRRRGTERTAESEAATEPNETYRRVGGNSRTRDPILYAQHCKEPVKTSQQFEAWWRGDSS